MEILYIDLAIKKLSLMCGLIMNELDGIILYKYALVLH